MSDEQRREHIYRGDIFVYSPTPVSLALCRLAARMCEDAFAPHAPQTAQQHFAVEDYAAILSTLKPAFIHHADAKRHIQAMLVERGCAQDDTFFDVPRLRTSTSDGYLTSGMAYAFHPHRDCWYSAPSCQINWWMPVYPATAGNVMAFHPQYFDRKVANTSSGYDYYEWNKTSRRSAATQVGKDTRVQPKATVDIDAEADLRVVAPVGGVMLFSADHLHSSVENRSGVTRISIDFRVVNLDDARARRGAPTVDSACTGTTLRDYLRCSDLSRMPEEVALLHDSGDGANRGELVYDPNA
jgi:hypothetical protein